MCNAIGKPVTGFCHSYGQTARRAPAKSPYACRGEVWQGLPAHHRRAGGQLAGSGKDPPESSPACVDPKYQLSDDDREGVARVVDSLGPLTQRQRDTLGRLLRKPT